MKNLPFLKRMDDVESPTININNLNTEPISKQGKPPTAQLSKIDVDKIFTLKNVGKFLKLSKQDSVKETTKGIGKSLLDKYSNILGEKLTHTELPGIETLGKRLILNSNQVEEAVETQEEAVETQEELVKQGKLPPKPPPGSTNRVSDKVDKIVEEFKPEKIDTGKDQLQLSSEHLLDSSEKLRITSENLKEVGTAKPKVTDIDAAATEKEKELESKINFDNLSDNIQATQERETDRLIDFLEDISGSVESSGRGQSAILAGLAAFFTGGAGLAAMLSTSVSGILAGGIGGILGATGLLAAAGAAGYAVGTLIDKYFVEPAMVKVYKAREERLSKSSTQAIEEQQTSLSKSKDVSLSFEKRAEEKRKFQLGAMGGFDKDFGATFKVNNAEISAHVKKFDADNMELYSQYSVNEVKALRSAFKFADIGGGENNEEYAKRYVDTFKKRLIKKGTKLTDVQLKEQAVKIEKRDKKRVEEKKVEVEKIPSIVTPTVATEVVAKTDEIRQEQIKKAENIYISDFDNSLAERAKEKKVEVEKIPSIVTPTVTTESVAKTDEIRQEQIKKAENIYISDFDKSLAERAKEKKDSGKKIGSNSQQVLDKVNRKKQKIEEAKNLTQEQIIGIKEKELIQIQKSIKNAPKTEKEWDEYYKSDKYNDYADAETYKGHLKNLEKSKHKKVKVEGDITKLESKSIDEAIKYKPVIVVEKPVGIGVASSVRGIPIIKPQVLDKSDEVIKQIAKKEKSEKIVTERTIETKGKLETTQAPQPQIVAVPIPAQEKPITRRVTSVDDAGVELLRTLLAG